MRNETGFSCPCILTTHKPGKKNYLPMELLTAYQHYFSSPPELCACAPGRVNLLGEHVDYNDGLVLPAAIDRAVHLAAAPSGDNTVTLAALDLDQQVTFQLAEMETKQDITGAPLPTWARYAAGVAWVLSNEGLEVKGLRAAFTSDVPIGAGLSSSAALEVGFAVLWQALGGWEKDPLHLAKLCQRAENEYVGVSCGLMDQFASACGVEGHALCLDTRSLQWEPVPLPENTAIVVADSGVRRSLTTSAYNDRRASCEKAVELLRQFMPQIRSLRDVETTEFAAYAPYLPDEVRKRAEHVVKEIHRVNSAISALHRNDRQAFGALMYACHTSLRNLYEVSTPELDTLVDLSRHLPGIIGARLTGAGFGGCTVNLIESGYADSFIAGLRSGYEKATGLQASVYLCQASRGAHIE
jgi:galactokinase